LEAGGGGEGTVYVAVCEAEFRGVPFPSEHVTVKLLSPGGSVEEFMFPNRVAVAFCTEEFDCAAEPAPFMRSEQERMAESASVAVKDTSIIEAEVFVACRPDMEGAVRSAISVKGAGAVSDMFPSVQFTFQVWTPSANVSSVIEFAEVFCTDGLPSNTRVHEVTFSKPVIV